MNEEKWRELLACCGDLDRAWQSLPDPERDMLAEFCLEGMRQGGTFSPNAACKGAMQHFLRLLLW